MRGIIFLIANYGFLYIRVYVYTSMKLLLNTLYQVDYVQTDWKTDGGSYGLTCVGFNPNGQRTLMGFYHPRVSVSVSSVFNTLDNITPVT